MPHDVARMPSRTPYSLTHLSDRCLVQELESLLQRERASTALFLAHIAEVDARRLYVPDGYSSMFGYCVEKLHLSEGAAYRRIRAARAARAFPALFDAVTDGRLHLAAVSVMAPYLTAENATGLIEAATHRRKSEIEEYLAGRFPSPAPGPRTILKPITAVPQPAAPPSCSNRAVDELILGRVDNRSVDEAPQTRSDSELILGRVDNRSVDEPEQPSQGRFLMQVTISRSTLGKLRRAQALLSHAVPSGDAAQVLDRALDALIAQLETRKAGVRCSKPEKNARPTDAGRKRYIPAPIRRAVWERDGGRCTFVGANGHRCSEVRFLEFDHVEPFARGGPTTVAGLRLRCRAHNQYDAERAFGSEFMNERRAAARGLQDLIAGLRNLGCSTHEARRMAAFAWQRGGTLEEQMRVALRSIARRSSTGP